MSTVKRAATLATCVAVFICAPAALICQPTALAQTMGEYGATLGHSASTASSMPRANPPSIPFDSHGGVASNPSGSSHTEVIRNSDDYSRAGSSASSDEDTNPNPNNPASGWERTN
ncbi:MAG: hypothetical protein ACREQN_08570 [Candidatus Binataceae bacterium]